MAPNRPKVAENKRVGVWIRVSTEDQARGDSPMHHEERARSYAQSKDWNVVEVYHLEAVSGKAVMGHAEAKRMMRDVERGHITGLIFSKLARLGRNTKELLELSEFFQKQDADLISLQESIDTSTPAGRLFYTMIAGMAHWEREEIASRVTASVPIRAKLGKSLGGSAPFGYKWSPEKRLVIAPETAPVRKKVFELFLEHKRRHRVACVLNEAGHRMPDGGRFNASSIERFLRDPIAKGSRRTNYVKHLDGNNSWTVKSENDWVYVDVEPIITAETWDRCNQILDEQKAAKGPRPARKPVQLFGGLTWCECGEKMYVKSNTPKYVCVKCRNKIAIEDLDAIFHEQLTAYSLSPREVAAYLKAANSTITEKEELLEVLKRDQARVKADIDRLYGLYNTGEIPAKGFGDRYRPLDERFNQMEEELAKLQGEIDFLKVNLLSQDEMLQQARNLYDHWPKMAQEKRRKVVEAIVRKITIGSKDIHFDLFYLPSAQDPDEDSGSGGEPEPPRRREASGPARPIKSKAFAFSQDMAKYQQHAMGSKFLAVLLFDPLRGRDSPHGATAGSTRGYADSALPGPTSLPSDSRWKRLPQDGFSQICT